MIDFPKEYSEDAEQAVLAAVLIDQDALARVRPSLQIGDFFADRHRHLYRAMLAIADRRDVIDPLTLSTELGDRDLLAAAGGKDYIGILLDVVPTAANVEHHAAIVLERSKRRAAVKALNDGAELLRGGSITAADMAARLRPALDALTVDGGNGRGGPLVVRSDAELERMPAMDWLADGLLPLGGLSALYGPPGAGKSFLAIDLAFSIATGTDWLDRGVVQGGTLYVAGEGDAGLSQRIVAWKASRDVLGQPVGVGVVSAGVNLLDPGEIARIVQAAQSPCVAQPVRLVVIDTLARSMAGGDENDTRDMSTLIAAADRIRHATGAAVMLVHHTKKESELERGSSALRGAVDTLILCRDGDDGREIVCEKQKDAAPFSSLPFRLVAGHGSCIVQVSGYEGLEGTREQAGAMTKQRHLALCALSEAFTGRGATASEWAKAAGIPERTFFRARTWLVREGYVNETPSGRYVLTPSGRTATTATPTVTGTAKATGAPNPLRGGAPGESQRQESRSNGSESGSYWDSLQLDIDQRVGQHAEAFKS